MHIAVLGATGSVGTEMLSILRERRFAYSTITAVTSNNISHEKIEFEGKVDNVIPLDQYTWNSDLILSALPTNIAKMWIPKITGNALVIDNSSAFRMDPDIPLIVPEINGDILDSMHKKKSHGARLIANPNCSTIQMVMVLAPLHQYSPIDRVVISTYQSVSGAGRQGIEELREATYNVLDHKPYVIKEFTKNIAFNLIPHIDSFLENGTTREEWKMEVETKKIISPSIKINATCVRVPVFIGHAESVNIAFQKPIDSEIVKNLLKNTKGVSVIDHRSNGGYITPVDCAGKNDVYVSRIRDDHTISHGINLWIVSDNLRKGAALNAVQIAELARKKDLI